MKDWKWTQDPKALLWIIGALVFLIWGRFAEAVGDFTVPRRAANQAMKGSI
jgi:hypothetical protein